VSLLFLFDAPVVILLSLLWLAFQLFQAVMLSSLGLIVAGATDITYFTAVACMPVIPIIPAVVGLPAKKGLVRILQYIFILSQPDPK
jgi:hypothetical protein